VQDLKGKTIGVFSLATGGIAFMKSYLRQNGMDPDKDVNLVAVGLGAPPVEALRTNKVQALLFWASAQATFENAGLKLRYLIGSDWRTFPDFTFSRLQKTIDSDPAMVEASRSRKIELLTGDATRDGTLDLCNLATARAVVAVTGSDTANLEVALGARARNPSISVVMRVQDSLFAHSIARHFEAIHTFSTTTLAAPAFAMLSRFPGTRGRIAFGDDTYNVGERLHGEVPQPPPADNFIPLAVWRNGNFIHIDAFEEMEPDDRLLFLVPLSQFKPAAVRAAEAAGVG